MRIASLQLYADPHAAVCDTCDVTQAWVTHVQMQRPGSRYTVQLYTCTGYSVKTKKSEAKQVSVCVCYGVSPQPAERPLAVEPPPPHLRHLLSPFT